MGQFDSDQSMVSAKESSSMVKDFFTTLIFGYFSYSTVKEVKTHNLIIAILFRILQLSVLVYVIYFDIIRNKSYQRDDPVESTVTSKVKGLGYNNVTIRMPDGSLKTEYRLFDVADYVIPPSEYNAIFVMTNFIETRQKQDVCHEDYTSSLFNCKTDDDCKAKVKNNNWNGVPTGKCLTFNVTNSNNEVVTYSNCQIQGWCPVEIEERSKRNLLETTDLSTCQYNRDTDPFCPIFPIQMILDEAEPDRKLQDTLLEIGGVIQIGIEWDCDLDWGNEKNCGPKYHFERFDPAVTNTSPGFNFRYADKYLVDEDEQRNLIKAYGLRFIITVTGKAGAFDFIPFFLTIGAGIGLLAIPTLVSDCILLNFTKDRKFYSKIKEYDFKNDKSIDNEIESRF